MLRESERERWQRDGCLVLESCISAMQVDSLKAMASSIIDDFDIDAHRTVFTTGDRDRGRDAYFMKSAEAVHCFLEEDAVDSEGVLIKPRELAINKIGHALHDLIPDFAEFCHSPVFAELFRDLGYTAPKLWQSMYIFKQPEIGGEVRWHQDASYLNCGDARLTGLWLALEDASLENGCLWVCPGAHDGPLREIYEVDHATGVGELRPLDETHWPTEKEAIPLEVSAGTLILFDGLMPHYSSMNRSPKSRQALTLHVTEADASWSRQNWLQRPNLPDFLL